MIRHNGKRGRLEGSEKGGITVSTEGWSGMRVVRHNGQHVLLEGSEEGRA